MHSDFVVREERWMSDIAASTLPFLDALAGIRTELLTGIMNGVTWLGDEKLFVLISLVVFWCISKHGGLYMLTVGYGVSNVGQAMKMIFRVPRPWNLGETPFMNADPTASGAAADGMTGEPSLIGKLMKAGVI